MITFQSELITVDAQTAANFRRVYEVDGGEIFIVCCRPSQWTVNGQTGYTNGVWRLAVESPDNPGASIPCNVTEGTRFTFPRPGRYKVIVDIDPTGYWYSSVGFGVSSKAPQAAFRFVAGFGRVSIPNQQDTGSGLLHLQSIAGGAANAIVEIPHSCLTVNIQNDTDAVVLVRINDWNAGRATLSIFARVAAGGFCQIPIRAGVVEVDASGGTSGSCYVNAIVAG